MGSEFRKWMVGIGAVLVLVLGIIMFSRGAAIAGAGMSKLNGDSSPRASTAQASETLVDKAGSDVQYITSTLSSGAYPDITVQSGIPVEWTIHADKGSVNGCNATMVISAYGLQVKLKEGDNLIKFTPTDTGTIRYSCWMGMVTGQIQVNENTAASSGQIQSDTGAVGAVTEPAQNSSPDTSVTSPATLPAGSPVGGCCGL